MFKQCLKQNLMSTINCEQILTYLQFIDFLLSNALEIEAQMLIYIKWILHLTNTNIQWI